MRDEKEDDTDEEESLRLDATKPMINN